MPLTKALIALCSGGIMVLGGGAGANAMAHEPSAPSGSLHATAAVPTPSIGALFAAGERDAHGCTASVVRSSTQDLIVTAAHCVSGDGVGMTFAPGYERGAAPYGSWTTTAAYVDDAWITDHDPRADIAVLRVDRRKISGKMRTVESVAGGSTMTTKNVPTGLKVAVSGYRAGRGDDPISCTNTLTTVGDYLSFACDGYSNGVSGSPMIHDGRIVGIIGGLHQGGCDPATSYSSDISVIGPQLVARASRGGHPDENITSGDSAGC